MEHEDNFWQVSVPGVKGAQWLSKVGAEILWKTSVEVSVNKSENFEKRTLLIRQPV